MNDDNREALRQAIAHTESTRKDLESGIDGYQRQISLLKEYRDGKRVHKFEIGALQDEIERNHEHIEMLRKQQHARGEDLEALRDALERSEEAHRVQEITINLRPKQTIEPTPGV